MSPRAKWALVVVAVVAFVALVTLGVRVGLRDAKPPPGRVAVLGGLAPGQHPAGFPDLDVATQYVVDQLALSHDAGAAALEAIAARPGHCQPVTGGQGTVDTTDTRAVREERKLRGRFVFQLGHNDGLQVGEAEQRIDKTHVQHIVIGWRCDA